MVLTDPIAAGSLAATALQAGREDKEPEAESIAERVLGLAARELGQIDRAVSHVRRSIRIADKHSLTELSQRSRVDLAWLLAYRGDTAAATGLLADLSAEGLSGEIAARAQMAQAHVLTLMGRLDEAVRFNTQALNTFRRGHDRLWEAMSLNNRGMVHAEMGNLKRAEGDLKSAERLYEELGNSLAVADVRWNLGFVSSRRGDLPAALNLYSEADRLYRKQGIPKPHLLLDRCELYLSARLIPEARQAALEAVEQLSAAGRSLELADATLMLAQSALLAGDGAAAKALARKAERSFVRQNRPGWLALSRYTQVRARWMSGTVSSAGLEMALSTARQLAAVGWPDPALDTSILASRIAIRLGEVDVARRELTRASRARKGPTVEVRTRAWHATALLRLSEGNRPGAYAALRAGMRTLDHHRASLGATELRAHASGHGTELAELGLRLALEEENACRTLEWMERWRAGALRLRPVRPSADGREAADCAELRRITSEIDQAALEGKDSKHLLRRQADLESGIRQRRWLSAGTNDAQGGPFDLDGLKKALDGRALMALAELDGRVQGVVVSGKRVRLHRLASVREIRPELDAIRFAGRRLAWGGPPRVVQAARDSLAGSVGRLEKLVISPLLPETGERPLVLVPSRSLKAIPWSLLPSLSARSVSVAPSAALWEKASEPAPAAGPVVLVAGPGLPGAVEEIAALERLYPNPRVFRGDEASASGVLGSLDGASLAHLATHAHFRADNPLFSSLELADGALMAYDLERLHRAPGTVVLSACDSGITEVVPGDELMGLASCLFSLGCRTLIASIMPVPDEATRRLMTTFHEELRAGASPAAALVAAQRVLRADDPGSPMGGAGFLCLGAG